MAQITMSLTIKRAWWVMPYVYGVRLFSEITGMDPDLEKVHATVLRGFTVVATEEYEGF